MNGYYSITRKFKVGIIFSITLLLFSFTNLYAQNRVISGKVIGQDDNLPLPGVNVTLQGTTTGTITDFDGNFSIVVEEGNVLVFSFIGMKTKTVTIKSQSTLNVTLESEVEMLDEVVKIGYGEQKKKEVSGAVAHVKAENLEQMTTSDLGDALQGQVAGVSVTAASGAPGESAVIQIRGVSTLSEVEGANQPLYVVDGIPQNEDPRLAPNEIASIDILKDLASCAVYGTRGANGVILITTKTGNQGKLKVSIDGNYGVRKIITNTPLMNASEQAYFDILHQRALNPGISDDEINMLVSRNKNNYKNDNNLDDIVFEDYAPTQQYNINLTGGSSAGFTYNLTGGYYGQKGNVINSNFERLNFRGGSSYKSDKWTINTSLALSTEDRQRPSGNLLNQTIRYKPYMAPLDPEKNIYEGASDQEAMQANFLYQALYFQDDESRDRLSGNISIKYDFTDWLSFTTNAGGNIMNRYRNRLNPYFKVVNQQTGKEFSNPNNSYYSEAVERSTGFSWDGRLFAKKSFGDHTVSALIGASMEEYSGQSHTVQRRGIVDNDKPGFGSATLETTVTPGFNYVYKIIGTIGRLQYDYKGKYLLSLSGNYNGNSKFAENNKFKFFPSASVGWNVSEEDFFADFRSTMNMFKIRASHGNVGGQSFRPYADLPTIRRGFDYSFNGQVYSGAAQAAFANPDIQWETSIQNNIGVDMAFFDNRLTFNADVYHTTKQDMLFPIATPASAGSSAGSNNDKLVTLNVGNMVNQGLELALGYKGRFKKLNWNITGTFATNSNEITNMNSEDFVYTADQGLIYGATNQSRVTAYATGHEAGAFFLYKTEGIINSEEKLAEYQKVNPAARMGDLMIRDTNGDGQITEADKVYAGSGLPKYEAGLILNLRYKNWDFMMNWYGAFGHEIMNGSKLMAYSEGRHLDQIHTYSADNPYSPIPAYRGDLKQGTTNFRGDTDLWLEDGSYLRLKNVTLGYTIPKNKLKKAGIDQVRFYIRAQNPLTFTKYTGYDPEVGGNGVSSRGLDKGNYPIAALYSTGFRFNF
ncbi:SusC/RagA family TonB-linked outer membrane protein [Flammeovirga yaeyamensis]|uniref:SusC/RagA family TonB-linked outer membrane protein n=1 Tax=Flammeovirga yaeyamensis TaxID=367791 RepID=A0AAX1NBW8_9BACT|nr:TonB-dependent receptor [Flammeovirga yaeyamensis]MBB3699920.1 TonB-linked SusC/RagA family outer membrane protein [Flammeovirga yaeyamensis]NMF37641.1 TonB-dependent receptor [Flammeovirga yaeyamensis]QWG04697.1 SusC/RagA family TonB-linked outer membrane protein [Flammeovirga yaeyamensis]